MVGSKRVAVLVISLLTLSCGRGRTADSPDVPDAGQGAPDAASTASLLEITLAPATLTLSVGASATFTVTGRFDDGSMQTIRSGLTWESSASAVVAIDDGVASGASAGQAVITVRHAGLSASADVTVSDDAGVRRVFADEYAADVLYAPFGGSATAPSIDPSEHHSGSAALRLEVPASGYVGGAMRVAEPVDLTGFDAVSFWAKASKPASLNVVGLGNDASASPHGAEWNAMPLTTEWTHYLVPIPLPAKLGAEHGLFHFAEGPEEGAYLIWLDDIQYEQLPAGTLAAPAPAIASESVSKLVGDSFVVNGTSATWELAGAHQMLAVARAYFSFSSSDPAVATVDDEGVVHALGPGTAIVTGKLGDVAAIGALNVQVLPVSAPDTGAPAPTASAADVIALFSNAYTNVAVDSWRTSWSNAQLSELQIGSDDVKKYSNLVFVGVEFFAAGAIDASGMTHFHIDLWTPDAAVVRVKLVDFGANAAFGGGDDSEHELVFDANSTPALVHGAWVALDLPLASFTGLVSRAHLAQLILSSSASTVYVDNVYFHK
jgi:hypothetical protein